MGEAAHEPLKLGLVEAEDRQLTKILELPFEETAKRLLDMRLEKTETLQMEMDVVQHAQSKLVIHDLEARFQVLIHALRFEGTAEG